jgi:hypothetical protein
MNTNTQGFPTFDILTTEAGSTRQELTHIGPFILPRYSPSCKKEVTFYPFSNLDGTKTPVNR